MTVPDADAYGAAQTLTYAINDMLTAGIRGEIWRDDKGFYVASFADPHDPMRALGRSGCHRSANGRGRSHNLWRAHGRPQHQTTVPKPIAGLTLRPGISRRSFIQRHSAVQRFERPRCLLPRWTRS